MKWEKGQTDLKKRQSGCKFEKNFRTGQVARYGAKEAGVILTFRTRIDLRKIGKGQRKGFFAKKFEPGGERNVGGDRTWEEKTGEAGPNALLAKMFGGKRGAQEKKALRKSSAAAMRKTSTFWVSVDREDPMRKRQGEV